MAQNSTIHERIKVLVEEKAGGKNTNFALKLGVNEANIRGYIKNVLPKADVLEKIVTSYEVNALWLLTGEGQHTPTEQPKVEVRSDMSSFIEYLREKDAKILEQAEQIAQLRAVIKQMRAEVGNKAGTSDIFEDFLEEVTSEQSGAVKAG